MRKKGVGKQRITRLREVFGRGGDGGGAVRWALVLNIQPWRGD